MKCIKILILWWVVTSSLSFLYSHLVFAGRNEEIDRLKQELLELEKATNPLIQTFRKVSQLVSPSVVSLNTEKKESLKSSKETEPSPPQQNFQPRDRKS